MNSAFPITLVQPIPAPARHPDAPLARGRSQWLPVTAHIHQRYLVTYRAPATQLAALIPAPLTVDTRHGQGFISVCALEMDEMGVAGTPGFLRFANRELLYRIGVRVAGQPSFFTLRSDVSSRALALLGTFSHYRLRHARIAGGRTASGLHLTCASRDGRGDAEFAGSIAPAPPPAGSLFGSVDAATQFLLGMDFSVDVTPEGRVRVQDIDHDPWGARFVRPARRRFEFLQGLGLDLTYDNTLAMTDLHQTWRAARWF